MKKYMIMTDLYQSISDKNKKKWFIGTSEEILKRKNELAESFKNPETEYQKIKYKEYKNNPFFIGQLSYSVLENHSYDLEEAKRLLKLYRKIHGKEPFDIFLMKITKVKNLLDSSSFHLKSLQTLWCNNTPILYKSVVK